MDQAFDTHAVYRKLQDSDMPERQADAIVEVMSDTMGTLVTNEKLTAELDLRFGKAKEDFNSLTGSFIELKGDFIELKEGFIQLKGDLIELKEGFIQLKGDFVDLKESLTELKSEMNERFRKVDKKFSDMNERFTKLEAKLETDIAKSQRLMIATILGSSLTIVAMQFAALLVFLRPLLGE